MNEQNGDNENVKDENQRGVQETQPLEQPEAAQDKPAEAEPSERAPRLNKELKQKRKKSGASQKAVYRGDTRKANMSRRIYIIALTACVVVCAVAVYMIYIPSMHTVNVGDTAQSDIKSPAEVLDVASTEQLRQNAADAVEDVYILDGDTFDAASEASSKFLDSLSAMRAEAELLRTQIIDASPKKSELRELPSSGLNASEWESVLTGDGLSTLRIRYGKGLDDKAVYNILALGDMQFNMWLRDLSVTSQNYLRWGVVEEEAENKRNEFVRALLPTTPLTVTNTLDSIAEIVIVPTLFYDEEDTVKAQEVARNAVAPVMIAKGDVLVKKGDVITQLDYQILKETGYAATWQSILLKLGLIGGLFVLLLLGALGFAPQAAPELTTHPAKCVISCALTLLNLLISGALLAVSPSFNTSFMGALLISQLVSTRSAIFFTMLLALPLSLIAGGVNTEFYLIAGTFTCTLAGNLAGILIANSASNRSKRFFAGIVSGVAMIICSACYAELHGDQAMAVLTNCVALLVCNMAAAVFAIGFMPVFETVFNVATPLRLLELANTSHPLLQRLMLEAPGTYHHSMMVATLCENAASAVGANAALARAGAYFHDIGKLKRPAYFSENQSFGENPHDTLDPQTSAAIIIAHVKDGVAMAEKYKLPPEVIALIQQHHGTTMTAVFYSKAVQLTGDNRLPLTPFRYPGPRPQTKEAAILMLCDAAEAAVRSIKNPTKQSVADMITKVLKTKIDEFQFNTSPLAFTEVDAIVRSINNTFSGILHERIEYPDIDELKEELNRE